MKSLFRSSSSMVNKNVPPDGSTRVLFEPYKDGFELKTGDYVVLTDNVTSKSKEHTVTSVEVTGCNCGTNTVSGVYDPAYDLEVWLGEDEPNVIIFDGTSWTASFNEVICGEIDAAAQQTDDDNDSSSWDMEVSCPECEP